MSFQVGDEVVVVKTRKEMFKDNAYRGNFNKGDVGTARIVDGNFLILGGDNYPGCWMRSTFVEPYSPATEEENWI